MHIPAGYGQVNYIFTGGGIQGTAQVALGIDNTDADATAAVLAATMAGQFTVLLRPALPVAVTLDSVLVKLGPNDTGPSAVQTVGQAGIGSEGHFQPNIAVLVRKNTNRGGRTGRGRSYWPFADELTTLTGGVIDGASHTVYQSAFDDFLDVFKDANQDLVLLHSDPALEPTKIESFSVDHRVATQRRRLRR